MRNAKVSAMAMVIVALQSNCSTTTVHHGDGSTDSAGSSGVVTSTTPPTTNIGGGAGSPSLTSTQGAATSSGGRGATGAVAGADLGAGGGDGPFGGAVGMNSGGSGGGGATSDVPIAGSASGSPGVGSSAGVSGGATNASAGSTPLGGSLASAGATRLDAGSAGIAGSIGSAGSAALAGSGGWAGSAGIAGSAATGCRGAFEESHDAFCAPKQFIVGVAGASFGVDVTEVTRAQYSTWERTRTNTLGQTNDCSWNDDYAPRADCLLNASLCQGAACDDYPQTCIDWCDAFAYCAALGRRLCGQIGGGSNPYDDYAVAAKSQWYLVCTSGGRYAYPYGDSYSTKACNGADYWGTSEKKLLPSGSVLNCHGTEGYEAVFDMSGNALEFEDSCNGAGATGACRLRGGAFDDNYQVLACNYVDAVARNYSSAVVGFRCCSR